MTASPYALEIVNLKKAFGGLPVTQDVSLAIRPGERRLIIGPNGAGKTTLFNQVTGDLRPNSGQIKLFGADITQLAPHKRAHFGLSRTYQIITLFTGDTLEHNVTLGLLGLRPSRWQMWRPLSYYGELATEARRTLDSVGLLHLAAHPVSDIAYGEKRRVELAMALAQKPRVLLLDEPLAGLSNTERSHGQSADRLDPARDHRGHDRTRHGYRARPCRDGDAAELRPRHRRRRAGCRDRGRADAGGVSWPLTRSA